MSSNDALDRAVRALRETGETPAADVARTRARVLETLHRGERRGRRTFWVLLPIAAVLAASTALAKNTDVVRRAWTSVAETMGIVAPAPKIAPPAVPKRGLAARTGSAAETDDVLPAPPAEGIPVPPADPPASAATAVETGATDNAGPGVTTAPASGGLSRGAAFFPSQSPARPPRSACLCRR